MAYWFAQTALGLAFLLAILGVALVIWGPDP
jgi:hypothetical protein